MSTSNPNVPVAPEVEPFCMRILYLHKNSIAVHRAENMDLDLLYLNSGANFGVFARESLAFSVAFPEAFPPPYLHCFSSKGTQIELPNGWFMMPIHEFLSERSLWTPQLKRILEHAVEYTTGREVDLWMDVLLEPGPNRNMRTRFFDYLAFRMGISQSLRLEWFTNRAESANLDTDYNLANIICNRNNVQVLAPERFPPTQTRIGRQVLTTEYKRINDAKAITGFKLELWLDNEARTADGNRSWFYVGNAGGSSSLSHKEEA